MHHQTECLSRRHCLRLFLSSGLSLCLRTCPFRSTLATSASIQVFVQKFSAFSTVINVLPFFVCYMDSFGFRFEFTAKCFIYTYCLQPKGLRYSHNTTNTFIFPIPHLQVIFQHPLSRLRQTYPTPTSSNWPHYNNLQKQHGSLLLLTICHLPSPLLPLRPTAIFSRALETSNRHRGAWVLTLHQLATLQYNNRQKQQGSLSILHICRLASPLLPLPQTTSFSRSRHFQRSPGRGGANSPPPRRRNPSKCMYNDARCVA